MLISMLSFMAILYSIAIAKRFGAAHGTTGQDLYALAPDDIKRECAGSGMIAAVSDILSALRTNCGRPSDLTSPSFRQLLLFALCWSLSSR